MLHAPISSRSGPMAVAIPASLALAQPAPSSGPYKVVKQARTGGDGGFDYVYADSDGRRLYIPRTGTGPRVSVFNLDTLKPIGEIPNTNARGAAVDPKSGHGFASSNPVAMWDTKTLALIKTSRWRAGPTAFCSTRSTSASGSSATARPTPPSSTPRMAPIVGHAGPRRRAGTGRHRWQRPYVGGYRG